MAGEADILIVPDIEAGNMLAKELEYLGGSLSASIVMGARVPIILTSRSDSTQSRVASCAIASLLFHLNQEQQVATCKLHEFSRSTAVRSVTDELQQNH